MYLLFKTGCPITSYMIDEVVKILCTGPETGLRTGLGGIFLPGKDQGGGTRDQRHGGTPSQPPTLIPMKPETGVLWNEGGNNTDMNV